ncbi:hypothetical protein NBRC10512_006221 [Rhodotorula toruloides]|uniref:RHTO0S05e03554g1_1 n=2 Tax=Rhodotorula toruloides TaxID=5286 RepID=A0A061AYI9_RHOTO|nr:uncharacterized protein RHTO_07680 [Rhodotorula toruloides NP11]EMS18063.1 hypothetical protein RHTO_07680 [Rhodotorula toruloides NP11]CDR40439.1 RHTO0S05e03554g1_1 [Rhodotorula toruloides]
MPLLHGRPSTQRQAQPGHVDLEETVSVQGPTGQTTAAAAMQSILNDAARQQGLGVGHPGHKGEGPARSSHWAACQLSFVGSTGLALLHTHLRLTGQLAPSDPVHEEAWHEIQLPATAQTLDVLLHAPSRRNGSGNSIVEFKRLVRSRMHEYIDFFNPSLLQQTRSLRNGVELPDESFFVPAVMSGEEGAGSVAWSTSVAIPHLGIHPASAAGHLVVHLQHPNLGAILFFEVRKIWIHLDPTCPLRPTHRSQSRPVAYACLFNLILLGDLRRHDVDNEMCRLDDFPRIADYVLGNSHDDHGQRDFYLDFKGWVIETFKTPHSRNQIVSDTLAWLRQESLHLQALDDEDWELIGPELGRLIGRQLEQVVRMLE